MSEIFLKHTWKRNRLAFKRKIDFSSSPSGVNVLPLLPQNTRTSKDCPGVDGCVLCNAKCMLAPNELHWLWKFTFVLDSCWGVWVTSMGLDQGVLSSSICLQLITPGQTHRGKSLGWETAEKHFRTCYRIFLCRLLKCFTKNRCPPWFAIDHIPGYKKTHS